MAEDETEGVAKLPPDARLGSLDERLDRAQREEAERTGIKPVDPNYRIGQQVLGHLIGAPAGGFLMGLGLDSLFNTRPLFMLSLLFLGFGIGIRNIIRISKIPPGGTPGANS
jgi:ATP synthase protein I